MTAPHVCPPGSLYVCPTAREVESSCHGGHDVCCDQPEMHVPIPDGPGAEALSTALSEAAKAEYAQGQLVEAQQRVIERQAREALAKDNPAPKRRRRATT